MAKRVTVLLALLLGLAGAAWAGQLEDQQAEIQDILLLAQQGISDEVIIKHIEARGFVYDLTVDDILDLRDRGLSENVIEAMLDTAVDDQPSQRERVVDRDGSSTTSVYLSAGYFSPWYYYPYAWGFYYDPFPVCYGAYYYPFALSIGWGWYGSCHYWYPSYWVGYRWSSPYYWNYACARPHHYRPYPHYASTRWDNGRGLRNDRTPNQRVGNSDPARVHEGQPVARRDPGQRTDYGRQGQVAERSAGRSTSEPRVARSASRVRTPTSARTSQPATGRGSTTVTRRPSTSSPIERQFSRERVHQRPSYRAPTRTGESASAARRSSQSAIAPRSSTPQVRTPRTSSSGTSAFRAPSRTRPSSSFHVPSRGFSRPSAPAGGGRAAAPAGRGGGGGRGGHLH